MPIVLISKEEKFTVDFEGLAEFDLRRLPSGKRQEFIQKCTHRGSLDANKLGLMVVGYCITGWRGPLTAEGDPAELNEANVAGLPNAVIKFIGNELDENLDGGLDPTKTSGSTSEQ